MPQKPQLVKTAELSLRLESIDKMMVQVRQLVQSKQGDIYNFQDERSGSVKDILAVSKELSTIREQIEQLDAAVKNLRQQVAYSTINLKLEESQTINPTGEAFGVQVGETWKNSTHASGSLSTSLALGLLWLLPFTPFMAIGAGGVYYTIRKRQQGRSIAQPTTTEEG